MQVGISEQTRTLYLLNGNDGRIDKWLYCMGRVPEDSFIWVVHTDKIASKSRVAIYEKEIAHDNFRVEMVKSKTKGAIGKRFAAIIGDIYARRPDIRIILLSPHYSSSKMAEYKSKGIFTYADSFECNGERNEKAEEIEQEAVDNGGNMNILIDYENVHETGLVGSDYLCRQDKVVLFYSGAVPEIERQFLNDFQNRAGSFGAVKLKDVGKNGLDFYIAVRVGQILQDDPSEKILIVSKDTGFTAVREYCDTYTQIRNPIVIKGSIEQGIVALDGDTERRRMIASRREKLTIDIAYASYREREHMKDMILHKLKGTEFEGAEKEILEILENNSTPRERYRSSLHRFGRKEGTKIYRFIREAV